MAIQSQIYSENFGFGMEGRGVVCDDNYAKNGFGFDSELNFNIQQKQEQQKQQQQQFQLLPQKYERLCFDKNGVRAKNINQSLNLSGTIWAQMEKQRQEIDEFLSLQNERLRLALLEHRKQHIATILKKYESKALLLLRQKDEEIARALNKRLELENMIRAMELEIQTWQRVAKENEAMVISLNNTIEQLKHSGGGADQDAESCCDDNRAVEFHENEKRRIICRSCYSWNSCVIFLPCRHLASCKACDVFLDTCPVCGMAKKSMIEALF